MINKMIKWILKPIVMPVINRIANKVSENLRPVIHDAVQSIDMKPATTSPDFPTIIPLTQDCLNGAILLADRSLTLPMIPTGGIVAEIGVAYGAFSEKIINKLQPSLFYGIDIFTAEAGNEFWGSTYLADSGMSHFDYYSNRLSQIYAPEKLHIKQGLSWEVLGDFDDDYFDFVYVDGGHDYDSVHKDIMILKDKVKNGGYIQFNDYTLWSIGEMIPYGVVPAVNAFIAESKSKVKAFCFHPHGYHDVLVHLKK